MTVIKNVGAVSIEISNTLKDNAGMKSLLIIIGLVVTTLINICFLIIDGDNQLAFGLSRFLCVSVLCAIFACVLIGMVFREYPAYLLSAPGVDCRYIFKTTPAEDQVNICKAVNEMEKEIRLLTTNLQKTEHELNRIIEKCR
jgi:hypothetical protein